MTIVLNKPVEPNFIKLTKYLERVHKAGWYTNFGPLHDELTKRLESYLGVKNLLLVSNGTLAIQVAAKTLGIKSAITTPFSFVATSSALLWQGIELAYSDIDVTTYNLCPSKLDQSLTLSPHYDGVVATHVYGNPCDVIGLQKVVTKHNKKIIYDAAHAFDVKLDNESVLNYGDASTLSFHATKVFHTVEGGAIVFKEKSDYEKAKKLINFGIESGGVLGDPGINAKLSEYQCAVGLTLLDDIEGVVQHRGKLFSKYRELLADLVNMPRWHEEASYNGAYMPIYIESSKLQEKVMNGLLENGVQSRRYFRPSLDIAYKNKKSFNCSASQKIAGGAICLPLHYYMTMNDLERVSDYLRGILND